MVLRGCVGLDRPPIAARVCFGMLGGGMRDVTDAMMRSEPGREPGAGVSARKGGAEGGVFYNQMCPVCGRTLRIQVTLLGRRVYCQHCGGGFVAMDESLRSNGDFGACARRPADAVEALLERADLTLRRVAAGDGCGDPVSD
jgi:hypothetical protein